MSLTNKMINNVSNLEKQNQVMTNERWFSINGYENSYIVSSEGRVKSLERYVPHSRGGLQILRERILSPRMTKGYYTVSLSKNGKPKTFYVHDLVCAVFLKKPNGQVIDHINRNPLDNRSSNLRYCTQRENLSNRKNKSECGFVGVSLNSEMYKNRYRARIRVNGKMQELGSFHTAEEASKKYQTVKFQLENGK